MNTYCHHKIHLKVIELCKPFKNPESAKRQEVSTKINIVQVFSLGNLIEMNQQYKRTPGSFSQSSLLKQIHSDESMSQS